MCGRFVLDDIDDILSRYRITESTDVKGKITPHYNIAPSQHIPVIYKDEHRENKIEFMKWGLVPFWAKDPKIGYRMINARAETLTQKPSFKHILKTKRCLIPSSGFYEWEKTDKQKVPYYIGIKNSRIFSFAGLFDIWKDSDGNELKTFTIITTDANKTLKPIHDRMPVILGKESEENWLDTSIQDFDVLAEMLRPYHDDQMIVHKVSREVNNPRNDNPQLIREVH
ncbi:MAG: SOS response-associated peptidase [Candidatus Brocadiaceae bacterium]|nr:SOS response-associated peptidase [Candidatus Brocadiaceae bacterium]